MRATRAATDEELIASTMARLDRLLRHGVTVCEAKTGYDLTLDGEHRLLRLAGHMTYLALLSPDRRATIVRDNVARGNHIDLARAIIPTRT